MGFHQDEHISHQVLRGSDQQFEGEIGQPEDAGVHGNIYQGTYGGALEFSEENISIECIN